MEAAETIIDEHLDAYVARLPEEGTLPALRRRCSSVLLGLLASLVLVVVGHRIGANVGALVLVLGLLVGAGSITETTALVWDDDSLLNAHLAEAHARVAPMVVVRTRELPSAVSVDVVLVAGAGEERLLESVELSADERGIERGAETLPVVADRVASWRAYLEEGIEERLRDRDRIARDKRELVGLVRAELDVEPAFARPSLSPSRRDPARRSPL